MSKLRDSGLVAIVILGVVVRAWLLFGTPLVPGINGAYYLVQARSLLEKGALAVPDFPLTFFLHAFLAKILQTVSGAPLETAVLWATKLTDALLPPLVAVPVFLLIRGWESPNDAPRRNRRIAVAAAAVVAFGAGALSMVGEFQKNSLALVWLAGFIYATGRFLSPQNPKRAIAGWGALGFLALLGITHIGVFGTALVTGALIGLSYAMLRGGVPWNKVLIYGAICGVVLVAATATITWHFDPARVQRLIHAFSDPGHFMAGEMPAGFPGGAPGMPGPGGPGFPGGPGGPFALSILRFVPFFLIAGIAASAVLSAWKRRQQNLGEAAVVIGCAVTAAALCGPWFSMDETIRFLLIAVLPITIALSYALIHTNSRPCRIAGLSVMTLLVAASALQLRRGGQPVLNAESYQELAQVRAQWSEKLGDTPSERSLVVALHGYEWWSAWILRTHIAQAQAVRPADWQRFENVLFLEVKGGMPFPGMPNMPNMPKPPRGALANDKAFVAGKAMPPGPLAGPLAMTGAPIPADAEIVHDGKYFKLGRVGSPPPFVAATKP
jgi:hypothetical protein